MTAPVAVLIKDLTVLLFKQDCDGYEASDFGWLVDRLSKQPQATTAQLAPLALRRGPIAQASPLILDTLAETAYAEEAAGMLYGDD